jgi:hypothetical protein
MVRSPHLGELRELGAWDLGAEALRELALSPSLPKLLRLNPHNGDLGAGTVTRHGKILTL